MGTGVFALVGGSETKDGAVYLKMISEPEYRKLARLINAVEAIPSVLRRKYRIDHMPVRRYVRSKCWYFLKP